MKQALSILYTCDTSYTELVVGSMILKQ